LILDLSLNFFKTHNHNHNHLLKLYSHHHHSNPIHYWSDCLEERKIFNRKKV